MRAVMAGCLVVVALGLAWGALTVEAPRRGAAAEVGAATITEPPGVRGTLLYTLGGDTTDTLVVRRIGMPDVAPDDTVASYRMTGIGFWIDNPLFSPDGTLVAVKCADTAEQYFSVHVLGLADGSLAHVSGPTAQVANMSPVSWSPDGRTLTYWHGGYTAHERYWPPRLYVYGRETRSSAQVTEHVCLQTGVAWAPNSHLLYTLSDERPNRWAAAKPGVYSVTPSAPAKHTYVWPGDVLGVAVSPDSRWIAGYVGAAGTARDVPTYQLMLRDLRTGKTTVLDRTPAGTGQLSWSPDSRRLYTVVTKGEATSVYQYVAATSARTLRCTFTLAGTDTRNAFPGLRFLGLSRDEAHLFVFQRKELPRERDGAPLRHEQFLKAVALATGEVHTVCHTSGGFGHMDWVDASEPRAGE